MKRWQVIVLFASGAALLVGLLVAVRAARGPTWEGRTVESWVEDFRLVGGDGHKRAIKAIRAMGTNSIPALVDLLRAGHSWFDEVASYLPSILVSESARIAPSVHHWRAQTGLEALGAEAVPALLVLLCETNANLKIRAGDVLLSIGEAGVPALQQALTNDNHEVRLHAAYVLGRLNSEAQAAIPGLLLALNGGDERLRKAAGRALWQIDPNTASQAGVELTLSPDFLASRTWTNPAASEPRSSVTSSRSSRE